MFYTSFIYNLINNCTVLQRWKHEFINGDASRNASALLNAPPAAHTYSMYILYTSNIKLGKWSECLLLQMKVLMNTDSHRSLKLTTAEFISVPAFEAFLCSGRL